MNKFNYGDKCKVSFGQDIDFTYLSAHPNRDNMHFVYNSILGAVCALDSEIEVAERATQSVEPSYKADCENATEALTKIAQVINMQYGLNCGYENLPDRVQGAIDCRQHALKEARVELDELGKIVCELKDNIKFKDELIGKMQKSFGEMALSVGKTYGADVTHEQLALLIKDKVGQQELSTRTINHQAKEISKLSAQVGILEKELGDCLSNQTPEQDHEIKDPDWWVYKSDKYGVNYQHDGPHSSKDEAEHAIKSLRGLNKKDEFWIGKAVIVESALNHDKFNEEKSGRDLFELSFKSVKHSGTTSAYEGDWDLVSDKGKQYWIHFAKQLGFTTGI